MSEVTFVTFGFNDERDEQYRISLFIEGLLKQENPNWRLIFWDASNQKNKFIIPTDNRISIIQETIEDKEWHPAYIRNVLSLQVETDFLCHTNADVYFAPNFVDTLFQHSSGNKLVCCKRHRIGGLRFEEMKASGFSPLHYVGKLPISGEESCGECQCMKTKSFIGLGGYYGMIVNGIINKTDWKTTACMEDSDLVRHVKKQGKYNKSKHNIKMTWIQGETFLLHLHHPRRANKQKWNNYKNNKK